MATNRDLLKEAIADAKAVKETAIANAKAALEEAFTPYLKEKLSAKLAEMEVDEEVELEESDLSEVEKEKKAMEEEEVSEEVSLDELLAELEEEEDKDLPSPPKEERPGGMFFEAKDEEEMSIEDMSEDDLKSFIEDVIKDMVEAGELEAGESMEGEGEADMEDDMEADMEAEEELDEEFNIDELLAEMEAENQITKEAKLSSLDTRSTSQIKLWIPGASDASDAEGEAAYIQDELNSNGVKAKVSVSIDEFYVDLANKNELGKAKKILDDLGFEYYTKNQITKEAKVEEIEVGSDAYLTSAEAILAALSTLGLVGAAALSVEEIRDALKTKGKAFGSWLKSKVSMTKEKTEEQLDELYKELHEVNLLNAKLLYTNKIFRNKSLTESQKIKVLSSFDKATTKKEAQLIYETLIEGLKAPIAPKTYIKESLGSASKILGGATSKPIIENDAFARMRELAFGGKK